MGRINSKNAFQWNWLPVKPCHSGWSYPFASIAYNIPFKPLSFHKTEPTFWNVGGAPIDCSNGLNKPFPDRALESTSSTLNGLRMLAPATRPGTQTGPSIPIYGWMVEHLRIKATPLYLMCHLAWTHWEGLEENLAKIGTLHDILDPLRLFNHYKRNFVEVNLNL